MGVRIDFNDRLKHRKKIYIPLFLILCGSPGVFMSFSAFHELKIDFVLSMFFTLLFSILSFLPLLGTKRDDLIFISGLFLSAGATVLMLKIFRTHFEVDIVGCAALASIVAGAIGLLFYCRLREDSAWKDVVSVISTMLGIASAVVLGISTLP